MTVLTAYNHGGRHPMLIIEPEIENRHSKQPAKFRPDAIAINRKK
jgi:hypothetical protein